MEPRVVEGRRTPLIGQRARNPPQPAPRADCPQERRGDRPDVGRSPHSRSMRHSHHPLLRGAVAVVLGLLLALSAPAAGLDGPADSTDTDPVGVWPLVPRAGGRRRLRPAGLALRRRSPGRRPRRRARAAGAHRPAGHGDLRRTARRAGRRGGRPRADPDDVRAGGGVGLGRRPCWPPVTGSAPSRCRGRTASRGPACTGAGSAARPTSIRCGWSGPARCGCCPCGGTIPPERGVRPVGAPAGRPFAAVRW